MSIKNNLRIQTVNMFHYFFTLTIVLYNERMNCLPNSANDTQNSYGPFFTALLENTVLNVVLCETIIDEAGIPIDFTIIEVNKQSHMFRHYTREQLIGKKITEISPKFAAQSEYMQRLGEVAISGKAARFEMYLEHVNRWLRVNAFCPKKGFFFALYTDITSHVETEHKLKNSEEKYRHLLLSLHEGIWVVNEKGITSYVNEPITQMLGYKAEDMLGKCYRLFINPEDLQNLNKANSKLPYSKPDVVKLRLIKQDGSLADVLFATNPCWDEQGHFTGGIASIMDTTKFKNLERQKDEFLSITSHELKNSLTVIKAYSQLLKKKTAQNTDSWEYGQKIETHANSVIKYITDLMDVTRMELGKFSLNLTELDYSRLLQDITVDCQSAIQTHTITIICEPDIHVIGDHSKITTVLINLIYNAVKYSPPQTQIVIRTKKKKSEIITSVQDFGQGIPKDRQSVIFEKYYQAPSGIKNSMQGLGLGLYISRLIIEAHKGSIGLTSKLGTGSTFYFSLPLAQITS